MHYLKSWRRLPFHWLMPLTFFCIGLIYLYAAPHFEASDSVQHIGVIEWIAENGNLPVQSADHDHIFGQEGSQPPLYYLLMTAIWRVFDTTDFDDYFQLNPHVVVGVPLRLGNRNMVFYTQPYPPDLRNSSLALYAIRLITLGMATATVAAVFQSARTLMPRQKGYAVMATALAAYNPMFIFISASVSNDNLVSMFAALTCWQALLMLRQGFQTRRSILLAILIALATLSKLGGLVLAPAVSLAGLWLLRRTRNWRGFSVLVGSIIAACLLITGWWFARNLNLYGELFGTGAMLDNFGRRNIDLPQLFLNEFEGLRISYWAVFGAFSILTHDVHYRLVDALSFISVVGLFRFVLKNRGKGYLMAATSFLGILLAVGSAMLVWWTLQTPASTGRLLFPYITSISLLMALGLHTLRIPPLLVALPFLLFATVAPFLYIFPNYDHPPQVDVLPDSATGTLVQWQDITLVGYETPPARRWSPGDEIPLTLFWRPLAQTEESHALFISLIDTAGDALATIDTFPGWGTLPTTWWEPGKIYRDDYIIQIPQDATSFTAVQLHIGWYPYPDGSDIRPLLEAGDEAIAFTLPIGALIAGDGVQKLPADATEDGAVFGESIKLNAYRFSQGRTLELEWQVTQAIAGDWRVFAQALAEPYQVDMPVEILLQKDASPPVPLDYLAAGETFVTLHDFDLPAGYAKRHGVYIGWYNLDMGVRLEIAHEANMLLIEELDFHG